MNDVLVRIEGVSKRFGDAAPALDDVSATIRSGRITGLVGPDGAGKTTLIRILTGLMEIDAGRVIVLGHDVHEDGDRIFDEIGYMPQKFGLYEDLTVAENLALYADLRGLPAAERPDLFERLLAFTGLAPFTARQAGRLSGGMKQKLGLACALMRRPALLLLDEPSVGVDPISRRELWSMMQELTAEGVGVLWSTAYLDEAERCDQVLLLNEGRLLFEGPPQGLTERVSGRVFHLTGLGSARRGRLAELLDAPAVIDGVVQGRNLRIVLRDPPEDAAEAALIFGCAEGDPPAHAAVAPRFEDAFVDILGGGPGGRSRLAERLPPLEGKSGAVIEAEHLTKTFGDFKAVDDISFTIERGEIFGLLGPNGAGKSTTFKMLCGLLPPTSGDGRVAGISLGRAAAAARQKLGYMAQKFSLYGDLTALQNLKFFSGVYGLKGALQKARMDLMIESFDLGPYLDQPAGALPLGFKQRLALSCAVMHEPEILFLDEPTSGVDPVTRREFWAHINGLVGRGMTILVTTHFMDEAEYCDRVALIYRGRMIAAGAPDDLKASATGPDLPDPSLEDAFIALVTRSEERVGA